MREINIILPLALSLLNVVTADFFSAISDMENLLDLEKEALTDLKQFVVKEKALIRRIMQYLEVLKKDNIETKWNPKHLENPFNAFSLLKRIAVDFGFLEIMYNKRQEYERVKDFPTATDLNGAIDGLARLQNTYKLNITDLGRGIISGKFNIRKQTYTEKFSPLSASDCMKIGWRQYDMQEYAQAKLWLDEAYRKYENGDEDVDLNTLKMLIMYSSMVTGETDVVSKLSSELYDVSNETKDEIDMYNKDLATLTSPKFQYQDLEFLHDEAGQFAASCSKEGISHGKYRLSSRLQCSYVHGESLFLKIAPVKMEILHKNPTVMLFHEVISDNEIEIVKTLGRNTLRRAEVFADNDDGYSQSDIRITKISWLGSHNESEEPHEIIPRLTHRIADFTGLDMSHAEFLQLANYGIGGHYEPHYDHSSGISQTRKKLEDDDRIATVIFYLSDVDLGGATVFPLLDVTVYPLKGSAMLWYNLYPSGQGNEKTLHGACPVLAGDKWVMNSWIHESGQELRKPCPIDSFRLKSSDAYGSTCDLHDLLSQEQ